MESKEVISNYKKKVEELSVEKLKYEAQLKVLNDSLNESMQELKNFGYSSLAEAEESLEKLLKSLEQKTEEIDKALDIVSKLDLKDLPVEEKPQEKTLESFSSILSDSPVENKQDDLLKFDPILEVKPETPSKTQSIFDLI